jgi:hypothetical protein
MIDNHVVCCYFVNNTGGQPIFYKRAGKRSEAGPVIVIDSGSVTRKTENGMLNVRGGFSR